MIYPNEYELEPGRNYPCRKDFTVNHCKTTGCGIYVKRNFKKGEMVARMAGITVPYILQHTLQISPFLHLYDPHFTGLLLHSCNPFVSLDMNTLEIWALQDIDTGEALTMDYAQTEDKLFKQFPCACGAVNCRKWVTGRKESINEAGRQYLLGLERKCG